MTTIHAVRGGGGIRLHVREWGRATGVPILFIHGWSQNHLCWMKQIESALAGEFRLVAFDLRGHGMSDAPLDGAHYTDARLWAEDLDAIITDLRLERPVIVAWSYGGYVLCDYLRIFGPDAIAGIDFTGAAVMLGPKSFGTYIGPGFLDHFAAAAGADLPGNIRAMRGFLHACFSVQPSADDFETALCWNFAVPAVVRGHLGARIIDSDDVLRALRLPLLVTHGRQDRVVLPAMAEHILALCPTARVSWYAGVGHVPFLEDSARFNRELAAFAREVV